MIKYNNNIPNIHTYDFIRVGVDNEPKAREHTQSESIAVRNIHDLDNTNVIDEFRWNGQFIDASNI